MTTAAGVGVLALAWGVLAAPASAATIQVPCDPAALETAIDTANATPLTADELQLAELDVFDDPCTYIIPTPPADTDHSWYGPSGLPAISSEITIDGNGAQIFQSGGVHFRAFFVGADPTRPETFGYTSPGPGDLTLRDVRVENFWAEGGDSEAGGGGAGMGGAIFNQGRLTIDDVLLNGNTANGGDGDVGSSGGGGGIGSDAHMTPVNSAGGFGASGFGGASGGSPGAGAGQGGGGGGAFAASNDGSSGSTINGGAGGGSATGLGGVGRQAFAGFAGFGATPGAGGASGDGAGGGGGSYTGGGFDGGNGSAGGSFGQGAAGGVSNGPGGGGVGGGGAGASGGGGGGAGFGAGGGFGGNAAGTEPSQRGGGGGYGGGGGGGVGPGGYGGGAGDVYANFKGGGGAGMGGAIFNMQGVVTITDSFLRGNTATGGITGGGGFAGQGLGGAIFNLNGDVTLYGVTYEINSATFGADHYVHGYDSTQPLAGAARTATTTLDNTTRTDNNPIDTVTADGGNTTAGPNLATATLLVLPSAPVLSSTNPPSGSNNNTPGIVGTAPASTTVKLYTSSDCTGAVAGSGAAAQFSSTGVPVSVADNSTTEFWATASDGSPTSRCSPTSVSYSELTPPATPAAAETGQQAAALKKCKTKRRKLGWSKKRYKKCKRQALQLPV
jgi:hypothetical protein